MGLDISLLETFMLVADLGSFSGAARRLGLTQPAVSFHVKALEKELGASLIDRSHGRVLLTPAGRTAYEHARSILADRDKLIAAIPRATGEVSGVLRVGACTVPGEFLLPPVLAAFKKRYPDVTVRMVIGDSTQVAGMVRDDRAELGFIGCGPPGDLEHLRFAEDRLIAVMPVHHPLAGIGKLTLEDLAREDWVIRSESSGTRRRVGGAFEEAGIPESDLTVVAEMGSTNAVLSAVASGMGVALISDRAAEEPSRRGLVSVAEITSADLVREFHAVFAGDRPLSRAAEEFLEAACGHE